MRRADTTCHTESRCMQHMTYTKDCRKCEMFRRKTDDLKECLSARDCIIQMLRDQLGKYETLYKKSTDQGESFRYKYCTTAQKLDNLKEILKERERDNMKVCPMRENDVDTYKRSRSRREDSSSKRTCGARCKSNCYRAAELAKKLPVQAEIQKACDFQCSHKCNILQTEYRPKSPCSSSRPCSPKSPRSLRSEKSTSGSRSSRCRSSPEKKTYSRSCSPQVLSRPCSGRLSRMELSIKKKDQEIFKLQEALVSKNKEINNFVARLERINKKMFNDLDEKNQQISELNVKLKKVLGEGRSKPGSPVSPICPAPEMDPMCPPPKRDPMCPPPKRDPMCPPPKRDPYCPSPKKDPICPDSQVDPFCPAPKGDPICPSSTESPICTAPPEPSTSPTRRESASCGLKCAKQIQSLNSEIKALKYDLNKKDKEINDFVSRLEAINAKMQRDLDEKNRQVHNLNIQLKKAMDESKSAVNCNCNLTNELQEKDQEISAKTQEIKELKEKTNRLIQEQVVSILSSILDKMAEEDLTDKSQMEIEAREKIIDELRQELKNIKEKTPHTICEKSVCYAKLYDKEREVEKLKQTLGNKDIELKQAKEKINELQKEMYELGTSRQDNKHLHDEIAARDQRIAALVADLQKEMDRIEMEDKSSRNQLRKRVEELEAENNKLRIENRRIIRTMSQPIVAVPDLKEVEMDTIHVELSEREKEIQMLRNILNESNNMTESEVRELRRALRIKEKEVDELHRKMDELLRGDAPTTVKEMLALKNKRIENLVRDLQTLNNEVRELRRVKNEPPNVLLLKIDALQKDLEEKTDQLKELKLKALTQQLNEPKNGKDQDMLYRENEDLKYKLEEKERQIKRITVSRKHAGVDDEDSFFSMRSDHSDVPSTVARKSMVNLLTEVNFLNRILDDKNREIEELKAIIEKTDILTVDTGSSISMDRNNLLLQSIQGDNKEKTEEEFRKTSEAVNKELQSKQQQIEELKAQLAQIQEEQETKYGEFKFDAEEDEPPVKVFRKSLDQKDQEYEALVTEFANLQKENEGLVKKLADTEKVVEKLEGIISKFGTTEQTLKDNIKDMENVIDAYKTKVNDLYSEIETYKMMNDKNMQEIQEMSEQMLDVLPGSGECIAVQVDREQFCADAAVLEQLDWKIVEEDQCNSGLYQKNVELERRLYLLQDELDKVKDYRLIVEELEAQVDTLQEKLRKKDDQTKKMLHALKRVHKRIYLLDKFIAKAEVDEQKVLEEFDKDNKSTHSDDKSMKSASSSHFHNEIVKIHNQLNQMFEILQKTRSEISSIDESLMTEISSFANASTMTVPSFASVEIGCGTKNRQVSNTCCQTDHSWRCCDKEVQVVDMDGTVSLNEDLRRALEAIKWENVNMLNEMDELTKKLNYQVVVNEELEQKLQTCMRKQGDTANINTNTDLVVRKNIRVATDFEMENLGRVVEELNRKNKILENELANLKIIQPKRVIHGICQRQPLAYITRSIDCLQKQLVVYEEEITFLQKVIANSPTCYKTMLTEPEKDKLFNRLEYELMQKILQTKTLKIRYDTELLRNDELKECNKSLIIENKELKNVVNELLWQLDKCVCIKDKDKFNFRFNPKGPMGPPGPPGPPGPMGPTGQTGCDCMNMITDVYHMQVAPPSSGSHGSCICSTGCNKLSTQILFKNKGMQLSSHTCSLASGTEPTSGEIQPQGKNRSYSTVMQQMRQKILEEKHKNDQSEFYLKDKEDQVKDKEQQEAELREKMYTKALRRPSSAFEVEIRQEKINSISEDHIKGVKKKKNEKPKRTSTPKSPVPTRSSIRNSKPDVHLTKDQMDEIKRVSYNDAEEKACKEKYSKKKGKDAHQLDAFQYYQIIGESDPDNKVHFDKKAEEGDKKMIRMNDDYVKGIYFNKENVKNWKEDEADCEETPTDDSVGYQNIRKSTRHRIPSRIKHQSQVVVAWEPDLLRNFQHDRNSSIETQTENVNDREVTPTDTGATPVTTDNSATTSDAESMNPSTEPHVRKSLRESMIGPIPIRIPPTSSATSKPATTDNVDPSNTATSYSSSGPSNVHHFSATESEKLREEIEEKLGHPSISYLGTASSLDPITGTVTDGTTTDHIEPINDKRKQKSKEKKMVKKRKVKSIARTKF